jgi:glutamine amidotransferase-like uncharacterized protein
MIRSARKTPSLVQALGVISLSLGVGGCSDSRDGNQATHSPLAATAAVGSSMAQGTARILLFNGSGTSLGDVAALEAILNHNHFSYALANSGQLNAMSTSQLREYRLLMVPGGNFEEIGKALTRSTSTNIRDAVQGGLNYLGICAGAFLAGDSPYNGLHLTGEVRFRFYALEARGIRKAAVAIAAAGLPTLEHYWEDGPQFTGWGDPVAKYPDGTPAIVEGTVGDGWVILSGIHPEAPESWRRGMSFATPASVDNELAAMLVGAALNRTQLAHY